LILLPFLMAVVVALVKDDKVRGHCIYAGAGILLLLALFVVGCWLADGSNDQLLFTETGFWDGLIVLGELFLMCLVIYLSVKHKKYPIALLSGVQTLGVLWMELFSGTAIVETPHILLDRLSVILMLIVAVVGGLIVVYAVGYMRGYIHHHPEFEDRRGFFFPLLFVFLGAMFGLILSESITWMYFFWEITSVCSFLLIGYTKTEEAVHNSFRALWMNLLGGLGYAVGIIWFAMTHHTLSLSALVSAVTTTQGADAVAVACVALLAFAALTKSAQMPFSQWLLGAMVAPTPSSALLHSATMVKAGVYLLLRLAPAMSGNWAGIMVAFIGGFTFFVASLMAISQSDGKKVLAYSTISNLGLITACAGIGVAETVWAGLFLIIFHAVSKSMLFQAVGAVENATGSRDIEDMQGLILRLPKLACVMVIGICGMFLAPFGMLVSKWAALKAFVDASGLLGTILVLFVCFGSATTLLYWSKWLTKLLALNHSHHGEDVTEDNEYLSLFIHAAIMLLLCVSFPMLSQSVVQPIVTGMYGSVDPTISTGNLLVMVMLLLCVFIFPLLLFLASRNLKGHVVMNYMAGVNAGDGRHFIDSMGEEKEIQLSAWYLSDWFGEEKLMGISLAVSALAIIMMMALILGGVFA
jgi:ech hydrogenase subunit A